MKTYYEMLEVAVTAPPDEIKRAFRREIAKCHPDKVQHLGEELQRIAAAKATELTHAYKTLSDGALRAAYDAQLSEAVAEETPALPSEPSSADVRRFTQALDAEFGQYEQPRVDGFEVACVPKPGFWQLTLPPRILGRFVPKVDAASLAAAWDHATLMRQEAQRDLCVFLMGPVVAAPGALAQAINEQRRKPAPAGGAVIMVPLNTSTWSAHVPQDAPPVIKSVVLRLKAAV
jgi:hypothetical protein